MDVSVRIIREEDSYELEKAINQKLKGLRGSGYSIRDIKYAIDSHKIGYCNEVIHYAMIICERY